MPLGPWRPETVDPPVQNATRKPMPLRDWSWAALALLLSMSPIGAGAQPIEAGELLVSWGDELWRVDPESGARSRFSPPPGALVNRIGPDGVDQLAIDPEGAIFVVSGGQVVEIDPASGARAVSVTGPTEEARPGGPVDVATRFPVNVFAKAADGDWQILRAEGATGGQNDLLIRIVHVGETAVSVVVRQGAEETLEATFRKSEGPDLNIFDYSHEGIVSTTRGTSPCDLPPRRDLSCTRISYEQVGTFQGSAGGLVEKAVDTEVLLRDEVKGGGVVAVRLTVEGEAPERRHVIAYGTATRVLWSDPKAGRIPLPAGGP